MRHGLPRTDCPRPYFLLPFLPRLPRGPFLRTGSRLESDRARFALSSGLPPTSPWKLDTRSISALRVVIYIPLVRAKVSHSPNNRTGDNRVINVPVAVNLNRLGINVTVVCEVSCELTLMWSR